MSQALLSRQSLIPTVTVEDANVDPIIAVEDVRDNDEDVDDKLTGVVDDDLVEEAKDADPETVEQAKMVRSVIDKLYQSNLDGLGHIVAECIFGERLVDNPNLLLSQEIDTNDPVQGIFWNRLCDVLKQCHLKNPDTMWLFAYGRNAGGSPISKFDKKFTFCSAVTLNTFQEIRNDGKPIVLTTKNPVSMACKIFHPTKAGEKPNPMVPKMTTRCVVGKGRSTIKVRDYQCYMAWVAWETDPVKSQQEIKEEERYRALEEDVNEKLNQARVQKMAGELAAAAATAPEGSTNSSSAPHSGCAVGAVGVVGPMGPSSDPPSAKKEAMKPNDGNLDKVDGRKTYANSKLHS